MKIWVIIMIAVISISPSLADNGEHSSHYKVNKNVYLKPQK